MSFHTFCPWPTELSCWFARVLYLLYIVHMYVGRCRVIYIFWMSLLSDIFTTNISSHFVYCLYILLEVFLMNTSEFLILIKLNLTFFILYSCPFLYSTWEIFAYFNVIKRAMFSLKAKSFIILSFIFKSEFIKNWFCVWCEVKVKMFF